MDADDAAPRRAVRRAGWLAAFGLFAVGVFAWRGAPSGSAAAPAAPSSVPPAESPPVLRAEHDSRTLSQPTGNPPGIRCELAQKVTGFLDAELAAPPIAPTPAELAESWASLLDPHGLWTAAPDSPVRAELLEAAPSLLTSFSQRGGDCEGASHVARLWQPAQERLRELYDAAFAEAHQRAPAPSAEVFRLAADPLFEDDPVTRPAAELARDLGARLGAFAARFPEETAVMEHARARFFPTEVEGLRDLAILAALRAYVPLVDPHGDFAPLDEEWSLYAGDDTLDSGSPLWGDIARTPLGARITSDPSSPLQLDDVVLAIDGLTLAGASVDQIEQAARSAPEGATRVLRVLRQGEPRLLTLRLTEEPPAEAESLEVERLRYGAGDKVVLRIRIPDVTDDMGEQLAAVLAREAPGASALLLDLRGNGGGSLDAAVEALGLFVPGAKLFPLIHRGAVTEVLQAGQVGEPYVGPLGVLVDGDTASAAEMLAGALQAYERATLIGARTFGKGCVQEYFDDVVADGVLRVTTLQFVMPNGKPLQQIGLTPDLTLALPAALERESELARQPITFGGPDVRSPNVSPGPPWPRDSGRVSGCEDPVVCRAISRLAGSKTSAVGRGPKLPDPSARGVRPRAGTR